MFSQFNEDSIIESFLLDSAIFIPDLIVDVGAGDGETISNSRLFIEKYGFRGVLVELDSEVFKRLDAKYHDTLLVKRINCAVDDKVYSYKIVNNGDWTLNTIEKDLKSKLRTRRLSKLLQPWDRNCVGIMSVDIEGRDTAVLSEFLTNSSVRPYIIIIEGNNPEEQLAQRNLVQNEYDLLATCSVNQIFIRKDILTLRKD